MDCSPPGTSVHGILQARILEQVAISFLRGSSQPRDQTWVSCIAGRCFTVWTSRESHRLIEVHLWGKYYILLTLLLNANFLPLQILKWFQLAKYSNPALLDLWLWDLSELLEKLFCVLIRLYLLQENGNFFSLRTQSAGWLIRLLFLCLIRSLGLDRVNKLFCVSIEMSSGNSSKRRVTICLLRHDKIFTTSSLWVWLWLVS